MGLHQRVKIIITNMYYLKIDPPSSPKTWTEKRIKPLSSLWKGEGTLEAPGRSDKERAGSQ